MCCIDPPGTHVVLPGWHIRLETSCTHILPDAAANRHLGAGAVEQVVLGTTFLAWLEQFIQVFDTHTPADTGANSAQRRCCRPF